MQPTTRKSGSHQAVGFLSHVPLTVLGNLIGEFQHSGVSSALWGWHRGCEGPQEGTSTHSLRAREGMLKGRPSKGLEQGPMEEEGGEGESPQA